MPRNRRKRDENMTEASYEPNKAELVDHYHLFYVAGKISTKEFFAKCDEIINCQEKHHGN